MNRCFALLLALLFASLTVSSACVAAPSEWVQFRLESGHGSGEIQASFHDERRSRPTTRSERLHFVCRA